MGRGRQSFGMRAARKKDELESQSLAAGQGVRAAAVKQFDVGLRDTQNFPFDDVASLRALLKKEYGSLSRAFRVGMDTRVRDGSLSLGEFVKCCRKNRMVGPTKQIWKELDLDENQKLSLDEFSPKSAQVLRAFCKNMVDRFGSVEDAWKKFKKTRMTLKDFEIVFADAGFEGEAGGCREVFDWLDTDDDKLVGRTEFVEIDAWAEDDDAIKRRAARKKDELESQGLAGQGGMAAAKQSDWGLMRS